MRLRSFCLILCVFVLCVGSARAQWDPYYFWTLMPAEHMAEIVGEASGETAFNTIMETGGYNKNRLDPEYKSTFYEAQYILDQLKLYGLPGAEIVRYPGREVWDGIKGELWEVKPNRQKIASYQDMTAMLASGSTNADVTAELIWVGRGTKPELTDKDVAGKIVVTEGSISQVHSLACNEMGAEGVIAISTSRIHFDPLQIPWRGIRSRRGTDAAPPKFAFYLPAREGELLKQRLLRREKITVHAQVEAQMQPYDLQDVVCHIPGTDPTAGEIIYSAHLFEGYVKQGANDNKSGSAGILEVARTLHTLIEEGRLPRPKRTIRFLWGPEFSGTGPWVQAHKELMDKTLCNINMDMVGIKLSPSYAFMCLMRTSYGNPHYLNDVVENYYRYVGETSRERIHNRGSGVRIVAPTGSDEPFYYSIETHYGASDHEVFNDWGVRVPGIMMITWPDQWYHTSGDRIGRIDPTQMKRTAVIGAAAGYTIAAADDDMALKIASEAASNGTRRLGQQQAKALEILNSTKKADGLSAAYKRAVATVKAAVENEKATLGTIMELASDRDRVGAHVSVLQKGMDAMGSTHLKNLEAHMQNTAVLLKAEPVEIILSEIEKKAAKVVPRPTARVKANGYRGYFEFIEKVPDEEKKKYPYKALYLGNSRELQLLINGENSVLDIQNMLDAQSRRPSRLEDIFNYLEILKLAGLVEF